ncbi:MAG: hypothetical protein J2P57_19125, partial [Acidimicrobiaceae bacterium]|nr:hypothetical protein [Acidimicrobiaceae bacterium]
MGEFARAGVPAAEVEQQRWRETRRYLNQHRPDLTRAAVALYPEATRVADTLLLSIRPWLPTTPQRLEDVRLRWKPEAAPALLTGREQASGAVRPHLGSGGQFASYADAIASLDRPRLFEDRPSYRLLDVDLATDPCF